MDVSEGAQRRGLRLRGRHLAPTLVLAAAALCGSVPSAVASSADDGATRGYLVARYRLVTALSHDAASAQGQENAAAAQIARACPGVVSGMPPGPSPPPEPPPRVRGEDARLEAQKQTIGGELDASVEDALDGAYRPADEAYAAEVRPLAWSNPAIGPAVQAAAAARLEAVSEAAPPFCADAGAWARSGFRILSSSSRAFRAARQARRSSDQAELDLETLLKPYEDASDRALIRRTDATELKLVAGLETAIRTIQRLKRVLGYPRAETEQPEKPVVLGRGHTDAGTRFEVTSGSGILGGFGCRRAATVAYTRPGAPEILIVGGPNNPICLSSPHYRHPALFCEAGIETIQTAVPASVHSARLVLADGRTIESRVVRVSRRDGGPSGIYAQQVRGNGSHATSLVELDARGGAVLTVKLPRYRCAKPRRNSEGGIPTPLRLADGQTPEGEPFTISAFGDFNGEPFVDVDVGVDPEVNEPAFGPGARKAFAWSLTVGCAPHPYAILYGILSAPGEAVTARTSQGVVSLNLVPTPARVHAKGPLLYGVFAALPSELTVLGANGSILYTEDLKAKATETAQFCEGYAEP